MEILAVAAAGIIGTAAGLIAGAAKMRLLWRPSLARLAAQEDVALALDALGGGYFMRDIKTSREYCTERLREMAGLTPAESGFTPLAQALGVVQGEALRQAVESVNAGDASVLLAVYAERTKRHMECVVVRITGGGRKPQGRLIIWCRDVTAAQKQALRTAKENEQLKRDMRQFSHILNVLPTPVWLRGKDFSIRYCNMAYSEAAEESPDRPEDQGALELHPHGPALAKSAAQSGEVRSERRHIIVGGARKLYQFTEIPLLANGTPQEGGVVGIAQDATELETVREELQRHINAQSDLLESVTSAMAVFGADTKLKFFNYAYVRLWGLDEAWLETTPTYSELLEVLREKRRLPEQANFPLFKQLHLKLFTDLIEPQEEIFYLPDGRTLRVLAIPHALGGILFAYEDVTDRLALERSYNTLSLVQKATLDNLHEGVVVFSEDGRLKLYNPKFMQLWKLEQAVLSPETHIADLIEKTRRLHHTDDWENYKQNFIANLHTRRVQRRRIERTDGTMIDSIVVPLPDGATLITFLDVTAATVVERSLRERNEALQEADRLKTEFLANVSYELRSPLTSISGFSEMLMQDYFGALTERQRDYVAGIHHASQHLMHLINDILDIASIEAGYMRLDIGEFDVHAMLQSVVSLVHERIREHRLQFSVHFAPEIGMMLADETRIKQIMFNLLSNAIKYSQEGGRVSLHAQLLPPPLPGMHEDIAFVIEDEGIGIAPEEQEAVFGKFFKGSKMGSHKSGAGLGLSMVKSFIELHGGRVELTSAPHSGTRITCILPRRNPNLLDYTN